MVYIYLVIKVNENKEETFKRYLAKEKIEFRELLINQW